MKSQQRKLVILFFLYGFLCAYFLVWPKHPMDAEAIETLSLPYFMPYRINNLTNAIGSFTNGHFPPITTLLDHTQGLYLYGGFLGNIFGFESGKQVLFWIQIMSSMAIVLIYPLEVYYAYNSKTLAIASPFLLYYTIGDFLWVTKVDVHWASVWCLAITMPLVCILLKRQWDKISWVCIIGICIFISYANILRSMSGLSSLVLVIIVLLLKLRQRYKRKWILLATILLISISSCNLLGKIIPEFLAKRNGAPPSAAISDIWHSIYIGLGYGGENKYGIYYNDLCGAEAVASVNPDIKYGSEEYFNVLKNKVFDIVKNDPIYVIKQIVLKILDTLMIVGQFLMNDSLKRIWWIVLCGILIIKNKIARVIFYKWMPIYAGCAIGICIGMAQPIIAEPQFLYIYPLYGSLFSMTLISLFNLLQFLQYCLQERVQNEDL